jgi:hypothetical protein
VVCIAVFFGGPPDLLDLMPWYERLGAPFDLLGVGDVILFLGKVLFIMGFELFFGAASADFAWETLKDRSLIFRSRCLTILLASSCGKR